MFTQCKNTLTFLTFAIILCFECEEIAVKDVTLTPNTNSQDGATVTLIKDTVINNDKWNLTPTDNIDWHIKITLDSSWGVHSSKDSRIRFIIDSDSTTGPPLLIAFSGTDGANDEFFTVRMFMDNSDNDKISPDCSTGTAMPHIDNIENIITNNAIARAEQLAMTDFSNFKPNNIGNVMWQYPMQWFIENFPDPVDNIYFGSHKMKSNDTFSQNCLFQTSFNPNNGLRIYIGGDIGSSYTFTSFRLIYEYDTTPPPTGNPTPAPTDCISSIDIDEIIDVGTLTGWNQFVTPEIAANDTFELDTNDDRCYYTNPCIKIKGISGGGDSYVYIERTFDVSNYVIITIGLEVLTNSLDTTSEMAYIETECDTNTAQRTEFNHGLVLESQYSGCFELNVDQCNSLILRIGGYLSGAGDHVYVTQLILQYETSSPTNNPTTAPTTNPIPATINPTPAPTNCFSATGRILDTTSLTGWNTIITPDTATNETFLSVFDVEDCYAINPCIRLVGETGGGLDDVYIEKILDVSSYSEIVINVEIRTESLEISNNEHGFIETICDSNTPQRIEFNHGIQESTHYSGCEHLLIKQCNYLTLRFGGWISGGGDRIFITKIEILYTTASPTINPTKYPTNIPSKYPTKYPSKTPTKYPSKIPSKSPTKYPSQIPTISPSKLPSKSPTLLPSQIPTISPSKLPSNNPSISPTNIPTISPSKSPSINPTKSPSKSPTSESQEGAANDETTNIPLSGTNQHKNIQKSNGLKSLISSNDFILVTVLIGTILCLILVICCVGLLLLRIKKRKRDGIIQEKNNTMELARVSSMSQTTLDGIGQTTGNINTTPMTPIGGNTIGNMSSFSTSNITPMMSVTTSNITPMIHETDNMNLQENDNDLMDESDTNGGNDEDDDDMYLDPKTGKTDDGYGYKVNIEVGSLNEGINNNNNNNNYDDDDDEDDNLDGLYGKQAVKQTPGNN